MKRNIRFAALLSAVLMFAVFIGGCAPMQKSCERTWLDTFDTVTQVIIYADSTEQAELYAERFHGLLSEYHRLYDIYNEYDGLVNLCTLNRTAKYAPVEVDPRIIELIEFSRELYELTDGTVNVAFGSVLCIWHEYRTKGLENASAAELPPTDKLKAAAEHTDINDVIIDGNTVYFADRELLLDVGAVAKGFALQKVVETLKAEGVTSMLANVGGNICTIGSKPDGSAWRVAVENPSGAGYSSHLALSGASVATSGDYQRYYCVDGKNYHHIIDTQTLMPSKYHSSVSVICRDAGLADGLSTALFNVPLSEGLDTVNSMDGVEAIFIAKDGSISTSDGFSLYADN